MSETPTTAKHVHGEAFRLMTYRSDDGTEAESIWNSRDGVTPFVITLRSGKQATHVNWSDDRYAPDHKPKPGDRIFVDITQERAREAAQRNAREWWDGNVAGAQQTYESAEALADMLVADYFQPGAPDLIEVPAEPAAVVTGPDSEGLQAQATERQSPVVPSVGAVPVEVPEAHAHHEPDDPAAMDCSYSGQPLERQGSDHESTLADGHTITNTLRYACWLRSHDSEIAARVRGERDAALAAAQQEAMDVFAELQVITAERDRYIAEVARVRAEERQRILGELARAAAHPFKGPNDTDSSMLIDAAKRIEGGYVAGGSHTSETTGRVLRLVAELLAAGSAPLRALLADEDRAVEFAARATAEKENPGVWDRAPEFRAHWREVASRYRPALAALREVANGG